MRLRRELNYCQTAFISGTFADMERWREEARSVLERARIFGVDLKASALGHRPTKEHIDQDLDASRILIGIYGDRYGSRVSPDNSPPSWSHYEYARFSYLAEIYRDAPDRPELLILLPDKTSEAYRSVRQEADRVFENQNLTQQEREEDRQFQQRFIDILEGTAEDFAHYTDDIPSVRLDPYMSGRIVARFEDAHAFREEILVFLARLGFAEHLLRGIRDETPVTFAQPAVQSAEPTPELLKRLTPKERPAGACVVVPQLQKADPADVGAALSRANPWHVAEAAEFADLSDNRGGDLLRNLQDFADLRYGADGDTLETLTGAIARAVAEFEEPEMFRFDGMPRGHVIRFVKDVWPKFQAQLEAAQKASGNSGAGLLMILTTPSAPAAFKTHCQTAGDNKPFSTPILVGPEAVKAAPTAPAQPNQTGNLAR